MRLLSALSCLLAAGAHAAVLNPWQSGKIFRNTPIAPASSNLHELEARQADGYWLNDIKKQGIAAFNDNPAAYKVWRDVKAYGAKGDGVTDDTDAINRAISDGNRCAPWVCQSSTTSPAIVYFPAGTYLVKDRIRMYYMTTLLGNPKSRAVIKASSDFNSVFVIDSAPYSDQNGSPAWISTNIFLRQIRNLVVDLQAVPVNKEIVGGIHWPASQATNLQNVKVLMTKNPASQHTGIFVENGSGGWMVDIETHGGNKGLSIGNQQFTLRNVDVYDANIGIYQLWSWGWLWQGVHFHDCGTGFDIGAINDTSREQQVGSVVIIDSSAERTGSFLRTNWTQTSKAIGAGQVILENIELKGVSAAVTGPDGTKLGGGDTTITAWGQGNQYTSSGSQRWQGTFDAAQRPKELLDPNGNGKFYSKQKPQYEGNAVGDFISIRDRGAKGDGKADDTTIVQNAITDSVAQNKILFFDHGVYKVTNTIYFPPGARIVGEMFAAIMASGSTWADKNNPVPVVKIGKPGEKGIVQWSDMLVQTQGPTPGAKIIEYNLESQAGSGVWDVHTRIGGSKGTDLQTPQCPISAKTNDKCLAAHTNVHITKSATGAYFENNWFWTADHDMDDAINNSTRVSVFTGRGLLLEANNVWLYGNGVEHHAIYQYQFANVKNVFAGYIQTETPYWQPNPDAKTQTYYPRNATLNDPDYNSFCAGLEVCDALGLRILNSENVRIYAGGLYSFFRDYDVSCSSPDAPQGNRNCQTRILSIENPKSVQLYGLSEVGVVEMLTVNGVDKARWSDNLSVYSNTIGLISV
ncbi:exo-beta 1,3 glucanase-like protein [Lophiotrema nucula]|uniref:Exo-beta 1,3 glucanase-like protein n=1 Tax=Lophiotrema nucula TaxID=690887 RepID=A0A6A5YL91_9PLEO|nr:exo-beta 1,3 glucanase-like protein [Lophiotrema nucula]